MRFIFIWMALSIWISGCASQPKAISVSTSAKAAAKTVGLELTYVSERNISRSSSGQCPTSAFAWRKEPTQKLLKYASQCTLSKKWDRLDEIGSHLATVEPNSPWGAYFMGLASQGKKEFVRAIWMTDLASKKSPTMAVFVYQKGRIQWEMGELNLAISSFEQSLKLDNRLTDAHLILAQIYYRDGLYSKADQHFSATLKVEPELTEAIAGLAETKLKLGKDLQAIEFFEQAVQSSPNDINLRLRLAGIYETVSKNPAKALESYRRIHSLTAQGRNLAQEMGIDLIRKIKDLEAVAAHVPPGDKITNHSARKGEVK